MVSSSVSPRRSVMHVSARTWATERASSTAAPASSGARRRPPVRPTVGLAHDGQVGLLQRSRPVRRSVRVASRSASQAARRGRERGAAARPSPGTRPGGSSVTGTPEGATEPGHVEPGRGPEGHAGPPPATQAGRQLGRGPGGHRPAVVDDDHPVGQPLGLGQLVGGEQHADAPVRAARPRPGARRCGPRGRRRRSARRGTPPRAGPPGPGPATGAAARPPRGGATACGPPRRGRPGRAGRRGPRGRS